MLMSERRVAKFIITNAESVYHNTTECKLQVIEYSKRHLYTEGDGTRCRLMNPQSDSRNMKQYAGLNKA